MTRRFEVGPILVALGAIVLLVSLFLDWYGGLTAWEAFEVVEVMLATLAVTALVIAAGLLAPDLEYVERRWLPARRARDRAARGGRDRRPAAGGRRPGARDRERGSPLGSALVMFAGAVLTFGRVSFAVSVEGRDVRERVAVVDHRQDTTESAAVDGGRAESAERAKD